MIAVAPTDLDWFHQLENSGRTNDINFWTPTPWNIKGLKAGDRFYFLLKAPIRKIGGYGVFREYVNLPASEAWQRFGTGNGVESLDELLERTEKYADKRSEVDRDSSNPTIGCIVLDDCELFPEESFVDPNSVGLDFPPTIVKYKFFDHDPLNPSMLSNLNLSVVTKRDQLVQLQSLFEQKITAGSDRAEDIELGFQGGKLPATVHWRSDLDLWMTFREVETRYWTAFGFGNPFEGQKSIIVEINSPFEGIDRSIGGVFLEDQNGSVYLGHRGKIGGGKLGIGKEAFMASIGTDHIVEFEDGDKSSKAILIGRLESDDLPGKVASFVRNVQQFKADAVKKSSIWWVNQGQTYKAERQGGFIWAPQVTKSGSTVFHHKNVSLVQVSDVVLHYASGEIVAIGEVTATPKEAVKPAELSTASWDTQGWLAEVNYWDLEQPISLKDIPEELRAAGENSPFNINHEVNQGYLYSLPEDLATEIRRTFSDRWPKGSPWHSEGSQDSVLHVLLKWKRGLEVSTIGRHKSIAEELGSVWWGKFGRGKIDNRKIDRLLNQIASSIPTYAFLYRQGEVWRADLRNVTLDPDKVPENRIPSYYSKDDCSAFFEISNFETLLPEWPSEHLVLASRPDEPERMPGALGNQATPLFVYERTPMRPTPIPKPELPIPDMEWLIQKTLWPQEVLEELCLDIRTTSPQVVLAGPPGTGKTWVAKHIAKYLSKGNALATRTVQFHPSYGYEEFIQGLRPVVDEKSGGIKFDVVDGVVVKMANDIEDEDQIYVLVIDEMNRANLPRVFGELMYLFEYREQDEAIDLQYSNDFSLPSNLKFIGTMNTADRSIRSIDIALRRRFEVFECPPSREILELFYEKDLGQNHVESLFEGFEKLNERLASELDRHHTIGHTFFMVKEMTVTQLHKIWERKLGPLIEEYFFDQPDIASEFSPSEFWPELESK